MMVWNMYQKIPERTVHALPFDGKVPGMWYFDGQIFYRRISREKLRHKLLPSQLHNLQTRIPKTSGVFVLNKDNGLLTRFVDNIDRLVEA